MISSAQNKISVRTRLLMLLTVDNCASLAFYRGLAQIRRHSNSIQDLGNPCYTGKPQGVTTHPIARRIRDGTEEEGIFYHANLWD